MESSTRVIRTSVQVTFLVIVLMMTPGQCVPQLREGGAPAPLNPGFTCPELDGDFEDPIQCDKYWRCLDGVPSLHICDDGLVFDINKPDFVADPCDSVYLVNCSLRPQLQEPTYPSEYCPRRHGLFTDPNPAICDVFYICKNGQKTRTPCTTGLHFDPKTGTCAWPVDAQREGCGEVLKPTINGFQCPGTEVLNADGQKVPHPSYPNLDDCQKFYVCLNGAKPQEAACNLGEVFNEKNMLCEFPDKVPECNGWYANDPRFSDYYSDTPARSADPGLVDNAG